MQIKTFFTAFHLNQIHSTAVLNRLNFSAILLYISFILVTETQNDDPLVIFTGIGALGIIISSNIQEVIFSDAGDPLTFNSST